MNKLKYFLHSLCVVRRDSESVISTPLSMSEVQTPRWFKILDYLSKTVTNATRQLIFLAD